MNWEDYKNKKVKIKYRKLKDPDQVYTSVVKYVGTAGQGTLILNFEEKGNYSLDVERLISADPLPPFLPNMVDMIDD